MYFIFRHRIVTNVVIAIAPVLVRLLLVPFIDDIESDGFSKILIAQRLADAFRTGSVNAHSFYIPAWMPAWHLLCAAVQLIVSDPYYVPKFLSAVFGGLTPAVVFLIARRLSRQERTAWIAWGVAGVAPLHVLYSTSAMTEPFYGFWFASAVYCLLRVERDNLWILGSAAALIPAALTRYEAWVLLPAVPAVSFLQGRARAGTLALACVLCAVGPAAWLALNAVVTGNPLDFLHSTTGYLDHLFAFNSVAADRGPIGFLRHLGSIIATIGTVLTGLAVYGFVRVRTRDIRALGAVLGAFLGSLFLLWLFRMQVGYMRHYMAPGMVMAAMAAMALQEVSRKRLILVLVVVEFLVLGSLCSGYYRKWTFRVREAAVFVRDKPGRIFCDDPGVKVLSRLPLDRFVDSWAMGRTPDEAVAFMRRRGVAWVVYSDVDYSPLPGLFPRMRQGEDAPPLYLVYVPPSNRPRIPRLLVYEMR